MDRHAAAEFAEENGSDHSMSEIETAMRQSAPVAKRNLKLSTWFPLYQSVRKPALRVFCFPYAGGSASLFREWPKAMPSNVELLALQLPARGGRLFEEPFKRVDDLVQVVIETVLPLLDIPFVLFGYSLGALLAFEVARTLQVQLQRIPEKVFVAACQAPQTMGSRIRRHQMSEGDLVNELKRLNGTPPEILENESMLRCFLPALRADFEMIDTYIYKPLAQLQCSIRAFGGTRDRISIEHLRGWSEQSSSGYSMDMIEGDHFFIKHSSEELLRLLRQDLLSITMRLGPRNGEFGESAHTD